VDRPAPAAIESLTVGINGPRTGPDAARCRGYTLSYAQPESARFAGDERLSDLWWTLAERDADAVDVRAHRPVRFDHLAVDWYLLKGPRELECDAVIELEVDGVAVGRASPPPACRAWRGAFNFRATTVVALDRPVETSAIRLVDRTPLAARRPAGTEGRYVLVERVERLIGTPLHEPTIALVLDPNVTPTSGPAPGGWRWSVASAGLYAVNPNGSRRRLGGPIGAHSGERVVERAGEGTRHWVFAPASMGNDGPLARQVFMVDAMSLGEPALLATMPGDIREGFHDACRGGLAVTLEDGRRVFVRRDGAMTVSAPPDGG
jgi:hypothetical protein